MSEAAALASTTDAPAPARDISIDVARGVAIILVVAGHSLRGFFNAGYPLERRTYEIVDGAIYLFHMPLFFMLSGVFFHRLLTRPVGGFLGSRVVVLLYPLLVWTWAMAAGRILAASVVNTPLAWTDFPIVPLPPLWQFWFLWALFVMQLVLFALSRVGESSAFLAVVGLVSVPLFHILGDAGLLHWTYSQALWFLPFFVIGMLLARHPTWLAHSAMLALAAFLTCEAVFYVVRPVHPAVETLLAAIASLSVLVLCRAFARRFDTAPTVALLAAIGVISMPIYLAHTFFSAPARILLGTFGLVAALPHVLLVTLVGLVCPIILAHLAHRLKVARLLGF